MRELLTTQEAARRLAITEQAVRRACREGRLAATRHGRHAWIIEPAELRAWADRRAREKS
jgi:excisionase family DNA binding protein